MSVGYFTDYGDSVGALSPLADVYKTECYELADYYNNVIFDKTVIPQAIIKQAPSAELAPGQKDSDSLIPYPVLDQLLNIYLESKHLAKEEKLEIVKNLKALIKEYQIADSELLRMLRLVDRAEFKRRKAPLIIKCHSISFGNGRRLPVAMRSNLNKNVLKYLLNEEI